MKKNTGKVLSLVLAMAMAVSTFTATFASAATLEVEGTSARVSAAGSTETDYDLVSDKYQDITIIENLDEAFSVQTLNREDVDDIEYVGFTKVSGDSLVKVERDDDDKDQKNLVLKKGASGTETIRVTLKGTYVDEDTDKDVTVRGTIDINFTVYTQGELMVGVAGSNDPGEHPDAPELAAVNDSGMKLQLFVADYTGDAVPAWEVVDLYENNYTGTGASNDDVDGEDGGYLKLSSTKIFNMVSEEAVDNHVVGVDSVNSVKYGNKTIYLPLIRSEEEGPEDGLRYYAKPATTTLEFYAPKVEVTKDTDGFGDVDATDTTTKGSRMRVTVGVGKVYAVGVSNNAKDSGWNTIAKIGSRTVIGDNPDSDDKWSDVKDDVKVVTGYDFRLYNEGLNVESGSIGDVTNKEGTNAVTVTGGSVGAIDVTGNVSVSEASVGAISADENMTVTLDTGASAASIDGDAAVTVQGATVSGNVAGNQVDIYGDSDYATKIGGNVTSDGELKVSSEEDESVTVTGNLTVGADETEITVSGMNTNIGGIDTDYRETDITFDEYKGSLALLSTDNAHAAISLESGAEVTVTNATYLNSINIDEESTLTFADTIKVADIMGDGLLKINSDKLYITSGIDSVKVQLLDNPTVGTVAFRATSDTVAPEDFNGIGFTTEQVSESSTTDKFVIDAVSFAGLSFDKSAVEIAKGYSDTVTLNVYPAGTTLPKDVYVSWNLEGDEDYITYELDATGTVATIKVLEYNPDYSYSNKATLTATLVDADGFEIEDYVVASCEITGKAVPDTTVTLDTTTVTKSVGQIYQFIAKSSDNSAITAVSSDESVATVALYDANDARGYKFQINAVGVGTATITATNATGATATMTVNVIENKGSLKIDTTSYTMAPGGIYDVKVTVDGVDVEPEVSISRDAIASLTSLGDGKYRITARNEGVTYVMAKVTVNGVEYGASVKVEVANGATASGVTGNNVTYFA